ncbi:MAG: glycosyltransferase family 4 protein [bacterium]
MRILIYTHEFPPQYGGAGRYAYELADSLKRVGQNVSVVAPSYGNEDFIIDKEAKFKVIRRPFWQRNVRRNLISLLLILINKPYHILMIVDRVAQLHAARLKRFWPLLNRYIITVHGSEIWDHFDINRGFSTEERAQYTKRLFLEAQKLIAVSHSTKELILEYLPIAPEHIAVIHNGISLEKFKMLSASEIEQQRHALGFNGKKILLCVARLAPDKGHDIVLPAFKKSLAVVPQSILLIAGDGTERDKLVRLAKELNCSKQVYFLGNIPNNTLSVYYNICDLFLLISKKEAFPFVCLEASACGKAIIAGRTGGVPELIEDGISGILVDPYNADALSKVIIDLLKDDNRRIEMGKRGRERVLERFTNVHMAKETLKVIENVYN